MSQKARYNSLPMRIQQRCIDSNVSVEWFFPCSCVPSAGLSVDDDADDDSVESDSGSEDDDDEHADESWTILRGDESSWRAENADTDTTEDVWEADCHTNPESCVAGILRSLIC